VLVWLSRAGDRLVKWGHICNIVDRTGVNNAIMPCPRSLIGEAIDRIAHLRRA
jgi:hypothetical protein